MTKEEFDMQEVLGTLNYINVVNAFLDRHSDWDIRPLPLSPQGQIFKYCYTVRRQVHYTCPEIKCCGVTKEDAYKDIWYLIKNECKNLNVIIFPSVNT